MLMMMLSADARAFASSVQNGLVTEWQHIAGRQYFSLPAGKFAYLVGFRYTALYHTRFNDIFSRS